MPHLELMLQYSQGMALTSSTLLEMELYGALGMFKRSSSGE